MGRPTDVETASAIADLDQRSALLRDWREMTERHIEEITERVADLVRAGYEQMFNEVADQLRDEEESILRAERRAQDK